MQRRSQGGFTLIEAVIAGGILAGGVLALAQVLVVAAGANRAARETTMATILAAQKVESLRAGAFAPGEGAEQVGEYRRAWRVEPAADDPADTLAIEVVVTPGGVRLATLRTRTVP